MLNPHEKGIDLLILWLICVFRENLRVLRTEIAFARSRRKNEGQIESQESQWKQKGSHTTMHGGGTTVLQGQKGGTACSTAVPPTVLGRTATHTAVRVTVRPRMASRAVPHGRASSGGFAI